MADASYGWDAGDSQPASCVGSIKGGGRGMLLSNLSCSHGPGGVTALSVSQCNLAAFKEEADSLEAVEETSEDLSWRRGEVIGHGSLGSVFTALNQSTGQIFAVKEVRIDARDKADLKFRESLENEIKLYKEMQHPRIVSYLGHGKVENNLYIYLEYMAGGSIRQVLSQFGAFDESLIATYTLDIVQGLDYLHTLDPPVLHRDVKGANILVGLESRVKLSDFGCSKRSKDTLAMSMRGSIPWMSPEVISQTGCGRRSDVWSLGCVVIEMATAKHPWGSFDNPLVAMRKIGMSTETPPLPKTVSDVCRAFMGVCTQRDKNLRPLAGALLEHEFIRDVQSPLG
jgi:serine/threonine protein kinase